MKRVKKVWNSQWMSPIFFSKGVGGEKKRGRTYFKKKKTTSFWNLCFKFQSLQWTWNSKNKFQTFIFQVSFASALAFRCASARARARSFAAARSLACFSNRLRQAYEKMWIGGFPNWFSQLVDVNWGIYHSAFEDCRQKSQLLPFLVKVIFWYV